MSTSANAHERTHPHAYYRMQIQRVTFRFSEYVSDVILTTQRELHSQYQKRNALLSAVPSTLVVSVLTLRSEATQSYSTKAISEASKQAGSVWGRAWQSAGLWQCKW